MNLANNADILLATTEEAMDALDRLLTTAQDCVAEMVRDAEEAGRGLDSVQTALHGLAWFATYAQALRQMRRWFAALQGRGAAGELERALLLAAFGEYLAQIRGGLPMSQSEMARPADLGLTEADEYDFRTDAVRALITEGTAPALRQRITALIAAADAGTGFGDIGLDDPLLLALQAQIRRFAVEQVEPFAHQWHLNDQLIPIDVVDQMSEMGVFGLTVPEQYGGLGLGKLAMVLVSEELSRAYIGVGSLGTRSEIAAELIMHGGTQAQKDAFLPRIAAGEMLPTAVFTEPNTGSDLGSLRTRAVKQGEAYVVTGAKTWITHASRSDVMTLLVRTGSVESGYRGLSMLLAEKPRGTDDDPFPAAGMTGGEIRVLGYRGMKEYELGFDGFTVPASALLGGVEGMGFKQLMATFESARVQTAARAVGVAQNAMELGLSYALNRQQFGRSLDQFPRVAGKLAMMAVETMIARQLTYFAAREKDQGRRCDIEAGMAKLLAARVAWSNADNALQIHGGNGYALEYPISRVLCDARILNIFEGAAEIQAQVIGRGLLAGRN